MAKAWTVPTCLWCAVLVVGMTSAQVRASSRRSENNERSVSVCDFANPEQPVSRKDGLSSRMRSIHLPRPSSQKWSEQRQQAVLEASHVKRKIEAEARLAALAFRKVAGREASESASVLRRLQERIKKEHARSAVLQRELALEAQLASAEAIHNRLVAKQLSLHQALTKALKARKAVMRRSASAASQSKLNKKPRRLQHLEKVLQMVQDAVDADARSRETSPSISLPQKRAVERAREAMDKEIAQEEEHLQNQSRQSRTTETGSTAQRKQGFPKPVSAKKQTQPKEAKEDGLDSRDRKLKEAHKLLRQLESTAARPGAHRVAHVPAHQKTAWDWFFTPSATVKRSDPENDGLSWPKHRQAKMKPAVMNDDVGWPDKRKEEGPDPLAEVSWEQAQQGADPTISDMRAADADKIQVQTRDSARDAHHEVSDARTPVPYVPSAKHTASNMWPDDMQARKPDWSSSSSATDMPGSDAYVHDHPASSWEHDGKTEAQRWLKDARHELGQLQSVHMSKGAVLAICMILCFVLGWAFGVNFNYLKAMRTPLIKTADLGLEVEAERDDGARKERKGPEMGQLHARAGTELDHYFQELETHGTSSTQNHSSEPNTKAYHTWTGRKTERDPASGVSETHLSAGTASRVSRLASSDPHVTKGERVEVERLQRGGRSARSIHDYV